MKRAAIFLDRDGTIIDDTGYIDSPERVRLRPGAAGAIRRLAELGYRIIVVSNQSGVARGLFTEETLQAVDERMKQLLLEQEAKIDAVYYCPYLDGPEAVVEAYALDSEMRKPNPGMILRAAQEWKIDLARSWMIGDSDRDVEAGKRAGCRTIRLARPGDDSNENGAADFTARHLAEALALVEKNDMHEPSTPRGSPDRQEEILGLLSRISEQLERLVRKDQQHDFSLLRLLGTLMQLLAIVAALWGAFGLLNDHPSSGPRLLLACYLQAASLTSFVADRLR